MEATSTLIGHATNLLDVKGRKNYQEHPYPLKDHDSKDWQGVIKPSYE
jgi:hypothetical protein